MRIEAVAFTKRGLALAEGLAESLRGTGDTVALSCPQRLAGACAAEPYTSLEAWARQAYDEADALIFVGACGIAVRAIAPYVRDKFRDPAVVCLDEAARFAIPLLSGHVGGANRLAQRVADICGAQPVITTATDVNGCFAVDLWAASQGLALLERARAKEVSAALLEGRPVGFVSAYPVEGSVPEGLVAGEAAHACELGVSVALDAQTSPFPRTLRLVPRMVTVGVGCKRGTSADQLAALIDVCLEEAGVCNAAVRTLASIDVKSDEPGLRDLAESRGWELRFHTAAELAAVEGDFASSEFVQQTVGVDNVCERAACAAGEMLLLSRRSGAGVTVALGLRAPQLSFPQPAADGQACDEEVRP